MRNRPIVMYLGGFAKVGGIEAFARDFLLAISGAYPERELVMWGQRQGNRLLDEIAESGAKVLSTPWRWGCRWSFPDYVLQPTGLRAVRGAAAVIFKRPPPTPILHRLREAARATGRRIPFILITPYRPAEYWGENPALAHLEPFDVIAVQSQEGARDLERMGYRGRIENIPLLPPEGTATVAFPSIRESGVIRLGFLGRFVAQKNLGYLIEIYRLLIRGQGAKPQYELHLFGEGNERAGLERAAANQSLIGVYFHGELPREKVTDAIDSCDMFLNTSLTEGQCLVALEVLSRGRPLVATPVGALPEVLNQPELGRLAPLGNTEEFANAVETVATEIRAGTLTPESVAAAFRTRYNRGSIVGRYLKLLAQEIGP